MVRIQNNTLVFDSRINVAVFTHFHISVFQFFYTSTPFSSIESASL